MNCTVPCDADLVLVGGRVTTLASDGRTPAEVSALAIRGTRIVYSGSDDGARKWTGSSTIAIDLGGRRVIPGLIDSHVHLIRAGLTWNDEVRWEGVPDLATGLARIVARAAIMPAGRWIRVIGGWHPSQFADGAEPTRADLDAVAPAHPLLVQCGYDWGMLNSVAMGLIDLRRALDDVADATTVDRDDKGQPTGVVRTMATLRWLYAQLPRPTLEEQVASTAEASRELSRHGITGVIDGGGVNTGPDVYRAVHETWRRGQLAVRARLLVHASQPGLETEQILGYLRYLPARFGDSVLRVLGIGEIVHFAIHDGFDRVPEMSERAIGELVKIFESCATERWPVQIHTIRPETIDLVLGAWERLAESGAPRELRWALVHGEGLTAKHIERLKQIGAGVLAPAMLRFEADGISRELWPAERLGGAPPVKALLTAGVPVGGGTDAMRVASYEPFTALHWYVTGRTVSGRALWCQENRLTREEALRIYTHHGAWFSFEEDERGRLQPGMLADLAVLDQDYFAVAEDAIPEIRSRLTLMGGTPSFIGGEYAAAFA